MEHKTLFKSLMLFLKTMLKTENLLQPKCAFYIIHCTHNLEKTLPGHCWWTSWTVSVLPEKYWMWFSPSLALLSVSPITNKCPTQVWISLRTFSKAISYSNLLCLLLDPLSLKQSENLKRRWQTGCAVQTTFTAWSACRGDGTPVKLGKKAKWRWKPLGTRESYVSTVLEVQFEGKCILVHYAVHTSAL